MAYRPCLICGSPSVPGRSRCSVHGRSTPRKGPGNHDSRQKTFRKQVLKDFTPGDPCGKCGLPIYGPVDAGHIVPLGLGGGYEATNGHAEHAACNRSEGARVRQTRFFPGR
jgi:hypothetical protein